MSGFGERLKEEIEYNGLLQKEVASMAGIKKRALDMYLGNQNSMPPADVAVRIARVLNVTVEYLVTGSENEPDRSAAGVYGAVVKDLRSLPKEIRENLISTIRSIRRNMG